MNCLTSLFRYTASRRRDALGAMRGLLFRHAAATVCRTPAIAPATPHLRHPIRGLFFQHINRVSRHYCTSTQRYSRWYYDPRKVALATVPLLGIGIGGVVIPNYYGYLETVPFTNRTHIVLRTPLQEREHSETRFANLKEKHASIILDPHHPDCVRLNDITSKLVQAVHSHLIIKSHDTVMLDRGNAASVVEVLRKKLGSAGRAQPATGHLNGLNWEVMVVEDNRVIMWCYPAGKIVVPTGFLQVFRTDAELATMLAHEVGHVVARHWAEKIIYRKCLTKPLRVPFFRRKKSLWDITMKKHTSKVSPELPNPALAQQPQERHHQQLLDVLGAVPKKKKKNRCFIY